MKNIIVTAVAAVSFAAAANALPADLVVISDKEVRPDEAAGFYYLGACAGGYLYNGSSAAVGRAAPYRVLDRDAQAKDYYIVWAPEWVNVKAEAFAHLGTSVRLSENEILVGLERGLGPGALRAVEHRIELIKLAPVTPVDWRVDAEAPPTKKDRRIEAAINSITAEEYAGYILKLQNFKTRHNDSPGFDCARDYLRNFFALQNLDGSLFGFQCGWLSRLHYPDATGAMYADSTMDPIKRSRDHGATWDTISPVGVDRNVCSFWLDGGTGFVAGIRGVLVKTTNGGVTWETHAFTKTPGEYEEYRVTDIYFVTPETGWIGGQFRSGTPPTWERSFFMKTEDGGRSWVDQRPAPLFYPEFISFFDERHGWASGYGGTYYTNNGGETWRTVNPGREVTDIAATGPTEAWATNGSNELLRTVDGVTWETADPRIQGDFSCLEFPDEKHGYAAGSKLIATNNGGASWREVSSAPAGQVDYLAFPGRHRGLLAISREIYRTDDGGATFADITENVEFEAENVIGERRGCEVPDEIVIICGHFDSTAKYDSIWNAPGAEDNGSGAACVMAAARAFRNTSFERTVRFIAFGGEEAGCLGSEAYASDCAAKGEKIIAVLNADMVSYDEEGGARDDYVAGGNDWLFDYLNGVGALYGNNLIYESGGCGSDHLSFWEVGYAALGVSEGSKGPGGSIDYPYYHTTEDTLDKIQPEFGARCARDLAATLAHLAGVAGTFPDPPPPETLVAKFTRPFAVYPNPYCYATSAGGVCFVGVKSPATVEIYDLAGRRVGRGEVAAGRDAWVWNAAGGGRAPGVYLYRV
ncbi:MAG TPA: M20/M25/M40 family metallo-hydrolase, partial [bacterium]|nr:M20/M25/M40 family metallo-hydrolase [bacterium]